MGADGEHHTKKIFPTPVNQELHDGVAPRHDNRVNEIRLPKECPSCGYLKLKEEDYV